MKKSALPPMSFSLTDTFTFLMAPSLVCTCFKLVFAKDFLAPGFIYSARMALASSAPLLAGRRVVSDSDKTLSD